MDVFAMRDIELSTDFHNSQQIFYLAVNRRRLLPLCARRWDVFPPAMPGFDLFDLQYPRDGDQ